MINNLRLQPEIKNKCNWTLVLNSIVMKRSESIMALATDCEYFSTLSHSILVNSEEQRSPTHHHFTEEISKDSLHHYMNCTPRLANSNSTTLIFKSTNPREGQKWQPEARGLRGGRTITDGPTRGWIVRWKRGTPKSVKINYQRFVKSGALGEWRYECLFTIDAISNLNRTLEI